MNKFKYSIYIICDEYDKWKVNKACDVKVGMTTQDNYLTRVLQETTLSKHEVAVVAKINVMCNEQCAPDKLAIDFIAEQLPYVTLSKNEHRKIYEDDGCIILPPGVEWIKNIIPNDLNLLLPAIKEYIETVNISEVKQEKRNKLGLEYQTLSANKILDCVTKEMYKLASEFIPHADVKFMRCQGKKYGGFRVYANKNYYSISFSNKDVCTYLEKIFKTPCYSTIVFEIQRCNNGPYLCNFKVGYDKLNMFLKTLCNYKENLNYITME